MNLGILGAGRIAVLMANTIRKMNQSGDDTVQLYAIASRDLDRAKAFAAEHGVQKAFGSYEQMLSDPDLDFVYIATPHSHHYQQIKMCADYGKHVLCEKALYRHCPAGRRCAALCQRKRACLSPKPSGRGYQPMRQMIQEALDAGVIGEPRMLAANLCYNTTYKERMVLPELAGGALLDVGIYALNFAEMVFGPADGLQGSCTKKRKWSRHDRQHYPVVE